MTDLFVTLSSPSAGTCDSWYSPLQLPLQVHDELLFEVREEAVPHLAKVAREVMESVADLRIPLPVKIQVGRSGPCMYTTHMGFVLYAKTDSSSQQPHTG